MATKKTTTTKSTTAKTQTTQKSSATVKKTPAKTTTSKKTQTNTKIYQLKITLKGIRPPIWRRVLVKSDITFDQLHFIIQRLMNWGNSHLYGWKIQDQQYIGCKTIFAELGFVDEEDEDERDREFHQTEIGKIIGDNEKAKFIYTYDFGDNWKHEILVEKILPIDPEIKYPVCITGKRAAPPEDCGGIWGYKELLEILQDPEHPEYEEYIDWVEEDFRVEYCNLNAINVRLQSIDL